MRSSASSPSLSRRVLNWRAAIRLLRASAKVVGALPPRGILTGSVAVAACVITASPVSAADYFWDGGTVNIAANGDGVSQGGSGTWSTAIANWDVGSGVPHSVWVDGNTANFGGALSAAATVTLGSAVTAGGIVINNTGAFGYTLATAGFQLGLTGDVTASNAQLNTISGTGSLALSGGGTHTFSLSGAALNISSAITGSDSITLTAGNLGLSGANTGFTGKVTANGGRLFINSDLSLGAVPAAFVADSLTLNGATFIAGVVTGTGVNYTNANPVLSANRGIVLGANGGIFNIGYGGSGLATINGVISGSGALTKADSGTLILNGANTYGGVTNVYNGGTLILNGSNMTSGATIYDDCTLQLGSGGTTGSLSANSNISITNGGSSISNLTINRSNAVNQGTDFATISGNGSVRQIGTGTTTLNAANTYTGGTTVSAGVLSVSTIADSGTSNIGISGALTLNGGTFQYTGTVATATGRLVKTNSTSTLEVTNAAGSLDLTGSTQGSGSNIFLTKTGAGTLTLSGTQDDQNLRVTLNAGTLVMNKTGTSPHAVGSGGGFDYALVINGGTARLGNTTGDQIYQNSSVNMTGGTFDLNGGSEGFDGLFGTGGTITNNAGATTSTLTLGQNNSGGIPVFGGVIADGAGIMALTKTGTGTQILTGANTYSGATTISGGTLQLGNGGTTGSLTGTSGITTSTGSALAINRSDSLAVALPIGGAGGFSQIGRGTTTLSLANTYTGATTVSGGTLNVDYNAAGAAASGTILSSSSVLTLNGGTFNVNGNATTASSQTMASLSVASGFGTVSTSSPGAAATTLNFTSGTVTRTAAGANVGPGTVNFAPGAGSSIKLGTVANAFVGTYAFYNNSAYAATDGTGTVIAAAQTNATVNGFTSATTNYGNTTSGATDTQTNATATGNSAVFSGASAKVIDIGATASNANTLTLNGFVNTGGALTIQDSGAGATGGLVIGSNSELVIGGNSSVTISAPIKNNGATASGVTLSNTGTVTLSGANTFTGTLAINAGTVNITSAGSSGAIYQNLGGGSSVLNIALPTAGVLNLGTTNILSGGAASSVGVINLSSGTVTTTGQMDLGNSNGGYAVLNMSGGALTVAGLRNGGGNNGGGSSFGNSYINQTGGTITNSAITTIGRNAVGTNIFLLNGATAVFNQTGNDFNIGYAGGGYNVATISAGTLNVNAGAIRLNNQNNPQVNILNLNGGTASTSVGIVTGGAAGTSIANFNGGTFQAKAATATISGLSSANIYSGGLTYDTNTFNNTVSQPLLGVGGTTGVSSIPLASNGTGYLAAPVVNISGGGGIGASAVAVFDPVTGTVTGITITSAGTGYTSAPTITLVGGGATTAATLGTPATAANATDGGLTKISAGTLTLTGASTYSGPTLVSAGTLSLDNNNTTTPRLASTSGITVNAGGTLLLAQSGTTASNDRIGNAVPVILSASATTNGGGKFSTGGLNEGPTGGAAGSTAAVGALTLSNNTTIDFTTGATAAGSNLLFASLTYTPGAVVSIRNFTGAAGSDSGASANDRLLFIADPGLSDAQLASITFYNDAGTAFAAGATEISFNGYFELVPAPVPEPATWAAGLLLVGTLGYSRRRQIAGWMRQARA